LDFQDYYYHHYAAFNAPCVGYKDDESQAMLKMAAVRHLGILKLKLLTANHFEDTFFVISLNFV